MTDEDKDVDESTIDKALDVISDGAIDVANETLRKTAKKVFGTYLELAAYKYGKYGEAQGAVAGPMTTKSAYRQSKANTLLVKCSP